MEIKRKELVCIGCPLGCSLQVELLENHIHVSGNMCVRGEIYANKEVKNPARIVTTTVCVIGGTFPVVSVKTMTEIPKEQVFACMEALKHTVVKAPIAIGDIILENVVNSGVSIVATHSIDAL